MKRTAERAEFVSSQLGFTVSRPFHGLDYLPRAFPAVNCWAIFKCPLSRTPCHELNGATMSNVWIRGYVYLGGQLIALQYGGVYWVHQEPYTKGQRFTNSAGAVTGNIVEVDPWGGNTARSANSSFQPHLFTSYERDSDGGDEAMHRRYSPYWSRFSQPDPYDGSYDSANPQSFNRYSYVNNDPVNFDDPSGLTMALTCLVDGIPSSSCTAALGLVSSGAGVIYGGTGWYGEGDIFVIDHLNMIDSSSHLNAWQTIFFMDPQKPDDELASNIVANGVEAALQVLQKGCWDEQQWNQDVKPANRYFANVQNADNYTKGWSSSSSVHALGVKESSSAGTYTVSIVRPNGTVDIGPTVIANAAASFNFVVKYYPGQGMAVTSNSLSVPHLASVPGYMVGLDPNVNVRWAQMFLDAAPKCKK